MTSKLKHILFLLGIFFAVSGISQSKMYFKNGVHKQKIPFEYHHNLIIFPLEVNGSTLNFILDTGASKTVIFTLTDSDSLTLNNTKIIELRGLGYGEPIQAVMSENNTINLGDIHGVNQTIYLVFDEQFDFSSKVGKTIHGIIGYDLLKDFIVNIDFKNKRIFFKDPKTFNPPKNNKKYSIHNLTFHHNKPYLDGTISVNDSVNIDAKILIDTGNSDALWIFENKEKGVKVPSPYFEDHLGEGLSGSIIGKRSKIKSFSFGNYKLEKPTAAFLDTTATYYARSFEDRNGSVGNEIMSRFNIILDYNAEKMYLKKNKSFPKEFKYNRAGIDLAYMGKTLIQKENVASRDTYSKSNGDNLTINFVINYLYEFRPLYGIYKLRPNSPAALAGLEINDILYKVNGKLAHEYEIEEIISLFYGDEGRMMNIQVKRNGKLFYYKFKLKDLL